MELSRRHSSESVYTCFQRGLAEEEMCVASSHGLRLGLNKKGKREEQ